MQKQAFSYGVQENTFLFIIFFKKFFIFFLFCFLIFWDRRVNVIQQIK